MRRVWNGLVDSTAPAERVAAFRVCVGVFVVAYLLVRAPVFWGLADRSGASFDGVGVLGWLDRPLPSPVIRGSFVVAVGSGIAVIAGLRFRWTGPVFAVTVLVLTTLRSSWGQLLHFENLFALHLVVLALSPAADVWSLDARRHGARRREPTTYGLVMRISGVCVVASYVIAGIAKLRLGGLEWAVGDTLRNHVAYSAVRLELLGGEGSPFAATAVRNAWVLPPMATAALLIELAAPVAMLGRRLGSTWVVAAWSMHVGILALMLVGFPYPLFLVAFAPFFELERVRDLGPARRLTGR